MLTNSLLPKLQHQWFEAEFAHQLYLHFQSLELFEKTGQKVTSEQLFAKLSHQLTNWLDQLNNVAIAVNKQTSFQNRADYFINNLKPDYLNMCRTSDFDFMGGGLIDNRQQIDCGILDYLIGMAKNYQNPNHRNFDCAGGGIKVVTWSIAVISNSQSFQDQLIALLEMK